MSQQQGNALSLAVGAHDTTCQVTLLFYAVVVAAAKRALALHEDVVRRQK